MGHRGVLVFGWFSCIFATMYFKSFLRNNPKTNYPDLYWRIVESHRNEYGRIYHTTLLNIGFIEFEVEKLNIIKNILNNRLNRTESIFEETDFEALELADYYWEKLINSNKIDASNTAFQKSKRMIDADTIKHKDAREIGAEWLCFQALEQLKIKEKLTTLGWAEADIQLALTQIISRAIYPFSENRTTRWIQENSAICEVTGYPIEKITKDKLYKSALI